MNFQNALALSALGGVLAVLFFMHTYRGLSEYSLILIFIGITWLTFSLTHPSRLLNFLGYLQNPPIAALITFFVFFIYMTYNAFPFGKSFLISSIAAIFGFLAGILIFKYWNIGS